MTNFKRIILDTDPGSDDAYAILILLHAEKLGFVKIEAIVCSMGNTTSSNACTNLLRLLELMNRTDIPVYKGVNETLIPSDLNIQQFHGADGFGDLNLGPQPDLSIIRSQCGPLAIGELVSNNPGEITLVCIGPLTNVALAVKLFVDFVDNVKDIFVMGGNYAATGNITASAEYNFYVDPEAAHILFKSTKCPVTILTWETCINTSIPFSWRWNTLGCINTPHMNLLNQIEHSVYKHTTDTDIWLPCDAFLVAAMLYPEKTIDKQSVHNVTVELHGIQTRGQTILDHLKQKPPNTTIIEKINDYFFKQLILLVMQS